MRGNLFAVSVNAFPRAVVLRLIWIPGCKGLATLYASGTTASALVRALPLISIGSRLEVFSAAAAWLSHRPRISVEPCSARFDHATVDLVHPPVAIALRFTPALGGVDEAHGGPLRLRRPPWSAIEDRLRKLDRHAGCRKAQRIA